MPPLFQNFEIRHGPYLNSPWHNAAIQVSEHVDAHLLRDSMDRLVAAADNLNEQLDQAQRAIGMPPPMGVTALRQWLESIALIPSITDDTVLPTVATTSPAVVEGMARTIRSWLTLYSEIDRTLVRYDPALLTESAEEADRLGFREATPTEVIAIAEKIIDAQPLLNDALTDFGPLLAAFRLTPPPTMQTAMALAKAIKFVANISIELYPYLAFALTINSSTLKTAVREHHSIVEVDGCLRKTFAQPPACSWPQLQDVALAGEDCKSNWFRGLLARVTGRRKRSARILRLLNRTFASPDVVAELASLSNHLRSIERYNSNAINLDAFAAYWRGLDTPITYFSAAAHLCELYDTKIAPLDEVNHIMRNRLLSDDARLAKVLITYALPANVFIKYCDVLPTEFSHFPTTILSDRLMGFAHELSKLVNCLRTAGIDDITMPFTYLQQQAERRINLSTAKRAISDNPLAERIPSQIVFSDRGCTKLFEAAETLRAVDRSGAPAEIRDRLLSPEGTQFSLALRGWVALVRPIVEDYRQSLEKWRGVAGQDHNLDQVAERPGDLASRIKPFQAVSNSLALWIEVSRRRKQLQGQGLEPLIRAFEQRELSVDTLVRTFEALYAHSRALRRRRAHSALQENTGISLDTHRERFRRVDDDLRRRQKDALRRKLLEREPPLGTGNGPRKSWTELQCLRDEFMRTQHAKIRDLMQRAGRAVQALKPCFLMSPMSMAKYLAAEALSFDLLVIDEASQMRPEDALGGLLRAKQIVVVGDPQQLPPTDFFSRVSSDGTAGDDGDGDDINAESILDWCLRTYPAPRRLKWHYRKPNRVFQS